jgi:hypothetical protein
VEALRLTLDKITKTWYNTIMRNNNTTTQRENMIQIQDATVETLDSTQARPVGSTVLSVTIGDHTFEMLVDEDELIQALASQYGCKSD